MMTDVLLVLSVILGIALRGESPVVELRPNQLLEQSVSHFANTPRIVVMLPADRRDTLNRVCSNLLALDLMSRGYRVEQVTAAVPLDSPATRGRTPPDMLACINVQWDSVQSFMDHPEGESIVVGYRTLRLFTGLTVMARNGDTLLSAGSLDTMRLFRSGQDHFFEPATFVAQRSVGRCCAGIPMCALEDTTVPPAVMIPVVFCVDELYRKAFPGEWQERLLRRLLYVNDIYRAQLPLNFFPAAFRLWDSTGLKPLELKILELKELSGEVGDTLFIGVTFNETLKAWRRPRKLLGLALPFGNHLVVSAIPTVPGAEAWNPLDEALVLAHEIGHIFGAPHVTDPALLMYFEFPGAMGYRFDPIGHALIKATATGFRNPKRWQMARSYLRAVDSLFRATPAGLPDILPEAGRCFALVLEQMLGWEGSAQPTNLDAAVGRLVRSTALREGLLGYVHFQVGEYDRARHHFRRGIRFRSSFTEVLEYLDRIEERKR